MCRSMCLSKCLLNLVLYVTPLEAFRLGNSSRTALILEVNWSLSKHLWLKWYEKA